jgi:hypothetical protein
MAERPPFSPVNTFHASGDLRSGAMSSKAIGLSLSRKDVLKRWVMNLESIKIDTFDDVW